MEILSQQVLKKLKAFQNFGAKGIVAGQAVSSAIIECLGIKGITPIYNDIDIFVNEVNPNSLNKKYKAVLKSKNTFLDFQFDEYKNINKIIEKSKYTIHETIRDDFLNYIYYEDKINNDILLVGTKNYKQIFSSATVSISTLVETFDINCTQVGIDLSTGVLYGTPSFWKFIETKQLEISNLFTPHHSIIRYFIKKKELNCYGDDAFNLSASILGMKIAENTFKAPNRFGAKMKDKALSNKDLLEYFNVISNKCNIMSYQTYSLEVKEKFKIGDNDFYYSDNISKNVAGYFDMSPQEFLDKFNITGILPILKSIFYGKDKDIDIINKIILKEDKTSILISHYPNFILSNRNYYADKHSNTVEKFLRKQPHMINVFIDINIEQSILLIKDLKKLEQQYGQIVYSIAYKNKLSSIESIEDKVCLTLKTLNRELKEQSFKEVSNDNMVISEITNELELYTEGLEMNHCVGGYGKSIEEGYSIILKLRHKREKRLNATIELKLRDNVKEGEKVYHISQFYHAHNKPANTELRLESEKLIEIGMEVFSDTCIFILNQEVL